MDRVNFLINCGGAFIALVGGKNASRATRRIKRLADAERITKCLTDPNEISRRDLFVRNGRFVAETLGNTTRTAKPIAESVVKSWGDIIS